MTLLAIKKFLQHSWSWLKNNWKIPLLLLWTLFVYVTSRRNTQAMKDVIESNKNAHKKEIEAINNAHADKVLKLKNLHEKFEKTLSDVEKNFSQQKKELTKKQAEEIKKIVIKSKGQPEVIKKQIQEEFGIEF